MKSTLSLSTAFILLALLVSCHSKTKTNIGTEGPETRQDLSAEEILGNPDYLAISYGGYRQNTRDVQPTIDELKEDMKVLSAMGIGMLRTYNVHLAHTANVLEAIHQLKQEDHDFKMYVMLGAWINCKDAWTPNPDHYQEDIDGNALEIQRAIELTNQYPDIVKVIAVGNEAMVKWAASYHVQAGVILKWVDHLQNLKRNNELPSDTWITSSDNFAAWGGGGEEYFKEDLEKLILAVDYVSLHIYPMHETHYNPEFWGTFQGEEELSQTEKIDAAMIRARDYGISQFQRAKNYIHSLDKDKPIHIGETGWASSSNGFYGPTGTKATDEYKEGIYYRLMREWTNENKMSCFYFEAFDENWKDEKNPDGSENHFGLFTIDGKAKFALWNEVDQGIFKKLTNRGNAIEKTYEGSIETLLDEVEAPPFKNNVIEAY